LWSIISSIYHVIHPSVRLVIHLSCHGLFTLMGQKKNGIQTQRDGESNRKRWHTCQSLAMTGQMDEIMFHIRLVIHPSCHGLFIPTRRRKSGIHTHTHTHTYIYSELKINNIFSGCHQIRNKIIHPTQNLTNLFHGEFSQNYELELSKK